jgi:hypothetical protein
LKGDCDNAGCSTFNWTPVDYPIASVTIVPSSVTLYAGQTASFVTHAWAPNGKTEIYNQQTSPWSTTVASIAPLASSAASVTPSQWGNYWSNYTNSLTANLAGLTTVQTSIGGIALTASVEVRPWVTLSGPSNVSTASPGTFTATVQGCNSTCSYQWWMQWTTNGDPNTWYTANLGTGQTQSLGGDRASGPQFKIGVNVTSNGRPGNPVWMWTGNGDYDPNFGSGGGGGGCDPNLQICPQ